MTFHLIVTCVSQKKASESHSILDPAIRPGTLEEVFDQWKTILEESSYKKQKAIYLYTGGLWGVFLDSWGIVNGRLSDAKLWILSAGYGLLNSEDKIIPYNITFQAPRGGTPSILKKISYTPLPNARMEILQEWWRRLSKIKKNATSIERLFANFGKSDYALVVISKDYLDAVFKDLSCAIKLTKVPENIAVISNNVNDPVAKLINSNWLYADNRFINLPKSNSTFVNGKIAHQLLIEMFENNNGIEWWSHDNFNSYLRSLSKTLPKPKRIVREPSTDEEVKNYIKAKIKKQNVTFSKLHRLFRDGGKACEYSRFRDLYNQVQNKLKNEALRKRPNFPVRHEPRKTKIMFFLPDWDDRVDPLFNFSAEQSFPNRDPYKHDVYHYEIYGHLNCDGILVSRSVLEENKQKINKISQVGIHKYLRLPSNVPVLADCGAFNYIAQETPPYQTDDILNFYQNLGFNYGVSIDHLIVPGVLKRKKYYQFNQIQKWIKISKDTFDELEKVSNAKIIKSLKPPNQMSLFDNEIILWEESYIDIDERSRRYNITINNAADFIQGYRDGNYSFVPIGAAQGWDPKSYVNSVQIYQNIGYEYIALGGLARSTSKEVVSVLEEVCKIKHKNTKLHVFGVARLDIVDQFIKYGVTSVDSAGMLRQAWLSSANNYHSYDRNHYTAIRVPLTENRKSVKKAINDNSITYDNLVALEQNCLKKLRDYDKGSIQIEEAMNALMSYHSLMGGQPKLESNYKRTLLDKPWEKCDCKLCKTNGIQVAIFRRNNRNRRRGFHNTWVFFKKFRKLTDIV